MAFSARNEQAKSFGTHTEANKKSYNDYSGGSRFQKKDKPFCTHCNFKAIWLTSVKNYMVILLDTNRSKRSFSQSGFI